MRFFFSGVPLDHEVHGPAQAEVIEIAFQEVVLRTAIYRLFSDIFVLRAAEYQDRNVWGGGQQLFKGDDTPAVWHFDVYNDAPHASFVEAVYPIRYFLNRLDVKALLHISLQRVGYQARIGRVAFDQQHALVFRLVHTAPRADALVLSLAGRGGKKGLRKTRARRDFSGL
jgi:hypothetical protein